jgi:hypothetical protein
LHGQGQLRAQEFQRALAIQFILSGRRIDGKDAGCAGLFTTGRGAVQDAPRPIEDRPQ